MLPLFKRWWFSLVKVACFYPRGFKAAPIHIYTAQPIKLAMLSQMYVAPVAVLVPVGGLLLH